MTPRISIVVVTAGRWSLKLALESIGCQMKDGDQIVLAGVNNRCALFTACLPGVYVETAGLPHWEAHDKAIAACTGDYLMFVDDDDRLLPGALDAVRTAMGPTMFRMANPWDGGGGYIWQQKWQLAVAMIAAEMFVTPVNGKYGQWGARHEGDYDFIMSTLAKYPLRTLAWREEQLVDHNFFPPEGAKSKPWQFQWEMYFPPEEKK